MAMLRIIDRDSSSLTDIIGRKDYKSCCCMNTQMLFVVPPVYFKLTVHLSILTMQ